MSERQNKAGPAGIKLEPAATPLGAWRGRLNRLYLPAEVAWNAVYLMPGLKLVQHDGLGGLIFIQSGENHVPLRIVDDRNTGIVATIGRDLNTLSVNRVNGEEWLAYESYPLRPASSLAVAASGTVTVPASGANLLYRIPAGKMTFSAPQKGRVIAYDQSGNQVYDSFTQGVDFKLVPKSGFIRFVGLPGVRFTVSVSP